MIEVCLLGSGGMMPLPNRWLTALLYRYNGRMVLVDCGEGTQIPIKLVGWDSRILKPYVLHIIMLITLQVCRGYYLRWAITEEASP